VGYGWVSSIVDEVAAVEERGLGADVHEPRHPGGARGGQHLREELKLRAFEERKTPR
jgi:hypothetical protein